MVGTGRSIAIIDGSFSGTLLAIHLLRRKVRRNRIYFLEKAPPFGQGVAYNIDSPSHLLNVRAYRMALFEAESDGFLNWLNGTASGNFGPLQRPVAPEAFAPRRLYRRYLQHCLDGVYPPACAEGRLVPTFDEVVDIVPQAAGLLVRVRDGRCFAVDCAVLSIGTIPPDRTRTPHYVGDPWDDAATADLDPAAKVLIIGTGPTMDDIVLSLVDQ